MIRPKHIATVAVCLSVVCSQLCRATVLEFARQEDCSMPVPDQPLERDLHTVLLAHLDSDQNSDADYARTYPAEIGCWSDPTAEGRFGLGAKVAGKDRGMLMWSGVDNFPQRRGTVEFWVKCLPDENLWTNDEDRWFFFAFGDNSSYPGRAEQNIVLYKDGEDSLLHFAINWVGMWGGRVRHIFDYEGYDKFDLTLPVAHLDPNAWHHLLISWDHKPPGQMWLLIDGEGRHAVWGRDSEPRGFAPLRYYQFGGVGYTWWDYPVLQGAIDEIRIQDQAVVERLTGAQVPERPQLDTAALLPMQDTAREWLDFMLTVQRNGAWITELNYPSLTPCDWQHAGLNDDSATGFGRMFLDAYRLWGDERYLRAACALGNFYIKSMYPGGGWGQWSFFNPDGSTKPYWTIANFEEWTQSTPIRYLSALYNITGLEAYREAANQTGELILRSQSEEGWWPWGAETGPKETRNEYMIGPTLNDWAMNCCMEDCLLLYHLTGDQRYLDAVFRAGEWFIASQLDGATRGWGAQYDLEGNPRWARAFEPPAADNTFGVMGAGKGLLMLYDLTGEERYLKPLRTCLEWLQSIPQDQKGWLWYAHRDWSVEENDGIAIKAGEPIVAYHGQMCPVNHPNVDEYLTPLNAHYGSKSPNAESWLAEELQKRDDNGPLFPSSKGDLPRGQFQAAQLTLEDVVAEYNPATVTDILEQFADWRDGIADNKIIYHSADRGVYVHLGQGCSKTSALLHQITLAYVALGELHLDILPVYATGYAYVDPGCDWYDVTE